MTNSIDRFDTLLKRLADGEMSKRFTQEEILAYFFGDVMPSDWPAQAQDMVRQILCDLATANGQIQGMREGIEELRRELLTMKGETKDGASK